LAEESWSGKDRDAFDKQMSDYQNQIWLSATFALIVHTVLKLMAMLIAIFIMMMSICAMVLFFFMCWIIVAWASSWVPIGGQMNLAAAQSAATSAALQVRMVLRMGEEALETAGKACAALIGALMGGNVVGQMLTGNTQAYADFVEATVKSADDVVLGRLSLLEQRLTGQLMRGRAVGGIGYGKWKTPMMGIPPSARNWASRIGGLKGSLETGVPFVNDGFLAGGSPLGSLGLNKLVGPEEYGNDYVKRTNPISVAPGGLPDEEK
ncbi:MAG: hypothetical protein JWO67_5821, partial [Streptosporangiaceae bacterium]|nr:hypothetical protein [Streptosporangiaceae bacterium]